MSDELQALKVTINQLIMQNDTIRKELNAAELRHQLLVKMLYDRRLLAQGEFESNWPLYLWHVVGYPNEKGQIKGALKVTHYGR